MLGYKVGQTLTTILIIIMIKNNNINNNSNNNNVEQFYSALVSLINTAN